jgi:hypothetical protein
VASSYKPIYKPCQCSEKPKHKQTQDGSNLAVPLWLEAVFISCGYSCAAGCTMLAPDDAAVSLLLDEAMILLGIDKWVASCNAVNLEHLQVIFQLMLSGWGASNSSLAAPQ